MERRRRARRPTERGTALVLVPTLALVVLTLGAIAIDLSIVHMAHRSVHRVVSAAADDAAGQIDRDALHLRGEVRVDPEAAARVARARVAAASLPARLDGPVEVDVVGTEVRVGVTATVRRVVGRGLPGTSDTTLLVVGRARLGR